MDKRKRISSVKIFLIASVSIAVIATAVFFVCKTVYKTVYPMKYTDEIQKYCEEYNVPESLMYAVINTESGYDENAKSKAGALGLTQITPETFRWLQTKTGEKYSDSDLYTPEISIKYGILFYSMLLEEFGDTKTAVAAYHAGRGKINSWLKDSQISPDGKTVQNIPTGETHNYAEKVLKAVSIYENLYKKELNK